MHRVGAALACLFLLALIAAPGERAAADESYHTDDKESPGRAGASSSTNKGECLELLNSLDAPILSQCTNQARR